MLTDGEVSNTAEVLTYMKNFVGEATRVFTFGIGTDASKYRSLSRRDLVEFSEITVF